MAISGRLFSPRSAGIGHSKGGEVGMEQRGHGDRPGTESTTEGQATQGRGVLSANAATVSRNHLQPTSRHGDFPLRRGVMFIYTVHLNPPPPPFSVSGSSQLIKSLWHRPLGRPRSARRQTKQRVRTGACHICQSAFKPHGKSGSKKLRGMAEEDLGSLHGVELGRDTWRHTHRLLLHNEVLDGLALALLLVCQ